MRENHYQYKNYYLLLCHTNTIYYDNDKKGKEWLFQIASKVSGITYDWVTINSENEICISTTPFILVTRDLLLDLFYEREKLLSKKYDNAKWNLFLDICDIKNRKELSREEKIELKKLEYKWEFLYSENECYREAYKELEEFLFFAI